MGPPCGGPCCRWFTQSRPFSRDRLFFTGSYLTNEARRLYRADFGTFEDYCRVKWGMSRFYAHRVMEAAETVNTLPMGNKVITSERQARELSRVPAPEREAVVLRGSAKQRERKKGDTKGTP
jgi:hypothetical protein